MDYLPRIVDAHLTDLLTGLPAIAIEGAKAVGKTATASRHAATVLRLDDEDDLLRVNLDPRQIDTLPSPVLIDEWQLYPPIWNAVRRGVDDGAPAGSYILTGSANVRDARIHSGAGRITRLRMRPMSFAERAIEPPTVSLRRLWESAGSHEPRGETQTDLSDYVAEILGSGFPGLRHRPERFRPADLDSYLENVVDRELPELGVAVRRSSSLLAWLRAYAAATSSTASYQKIADAVDRDTRPARKTVNDYRDALTNLWLLDPVPAWQPGGGRLRELGLAEKHHLADPALAARLLGITTDTLLKPGGTPHRPQMLRDGPLLGLLFESLVTLSVRVYAESLGLRVAHLRTHRGLQEVDLVLIAPDERIIGIEVKVTAVPDDDDVRHLRWLHSQLPDQIIDTMVITMGKRAYRRRDGVAVVPLALLGP